ncbi:MAG: CDC48 family AAA ATPase [Chlorobiales bacterium]|nr:CDC48 family AAA ATPase [Chlorobiales bacterium]
MKDVASASYQVKEALPKDVGRAICRFDPEEMRRFGFSAGQVVLIHGKRKTPVRIMPSYPDDRGKTIVQIDGITRDNAQVGLNDKVQLEKVDVRSASRIELLPLTGVSLSQKDDDSRYLGSLIEGLPVIAGDRIRTNLFGTKAEEFRVLESVPEGITCITAETTIRVKTNELGEKRAAKIAYEDIGGLGLQVQRIREMIELPLRFPQIFERLGIEPPKGVLLHGPPGTGKTLTARAVANETDAYFTHISGPEIIGKFYGESEARLRRVFEDAEGHAPAIIFIDEIDAIAPKREDMGGEKQVERRVVAQLLALLDGLKSRGQVIVIGATNLPNTLDPALRRPGRFDREISIPIPDKNARHEILQIHTRGMPLTEDVDLKKLAEITHGFVGADLDAFAREAAMVALRRILPDIDFNLAGLPYDLLMSLSITMDDFLSAMKEVDPSAIREVFVEIPNVSWQDVGGLDALKQELQEAVVWPLKFTGIFRATKTRPPKGILLYGPPGTGKTLIAKALATESEVNFIAVKGPELINQYIGESERSVREIFKKARQAAPAIFFLDEIDSLAPFRHQEASGARVTERVISQLLTEMDGIEELQGVLVLAATNRLDLIEPALLRSGRFDLVLEIPKPDRKAREAIFAIHTRQKPLAADVDIAMLAEKTEGVTGADIAFICKRASMLTIREHIKLHASQANQESWHDKEREAPLFVTLQHFDAAIDLLYSMHISQ